ncbi:MAG: helix-turn-helix transcriptional regulator [Bacteroidales bacterium]
MKNNIQSFIRYRSIDRCLTEKGIASLEDMITYCREDTGDETIASSQVEHDIEDMKKTEPDGYSAPISYNEQKAGYVYSKPGFTLNKIPLKEEENNLLVVTVNYLSQLRNHETLKGLKGMIQKITDTLKIRNMGGANRDFDFVQSEVTHSFGGSNFLPPIIKAIQNKSVLRIYYHPFYEDKPYFTIVHPYLLKEYRNRWYLIGLNDIKKELRTYGLDRIWEIHEIDQEYIPQKFNTKDYFRNTIGIISPIGEPPEIRLSVSKHQAQYLITQPLHESQFIESENDESVIFQFKLHPTYEFKSFILSMGSDARVLSPDKLKKDILRQLNDAMLEYGKDDY